MNVLVPLVFSVLSLPQPEEKIPFEVVLAEPDRVEMIAPTDSVTLSGSVKLVQFDVLSREGGSRRVMKTLGADGKGLDVHDGGPFGGEGFLDELYFTDRKNETMSVTVEVADAAPFISADPENSENAIIELTDRIVLTVFNYDTAEKERYVVRDNQIMFSVGPDGVFHLTSIRPKPNDLDALVNILRIYMPDEAIPIDAPAFAAYILRLYPLPR